METKKKKTIDLRNMPHDELLSHARDVRAKLKEVREANKELVLTNETQELLIADQAAAIASRDDVIDDITAKLEDVTARYEQAVDNNSRLRGVIEVDATDSSDSALANAIMNRLGTIISILGGDPSATAVADDTIDDDDDAEEENPDAFDNAPDEDDVQDEDETVEKDDQYEEHAVTTAPVTDDVTLIDEPAIHGADFANASVDIGQDRENILLATILPVIKNTIAAMTDYSSVVVDPVRKGDITKDFALRHVVSQAYEDPSIATAILESAKVRDAVYDAMGL